MIVSPRAVGGSHRFLTAVAALAPEDLAGEAGEVHAVRCS